MVWLIRGIKLSFLPQSRSNLKNCIKAVSQTTFVQSWREYWCKNFAILAYNLAGWFYVHSGGTRRFRSFKLFSKPFTRNAYTRQSKTAQCKMMERHVPCLKWPRQNVSYWFMQLIALLHLQTYSKRGYIYTFPLTFPHRMDFAPLVAS